MGSRPVLKKLVDALRLVGHEVTVYCRSSYYEDKLESYKGMNLVYLPSLKKKSLDTFSHTILSSFHALKADYDVVLVFNAANAPFVLPLRLFGMKIGLNTDGLEWKRSKWGWGGKSFYRFAEKIACFIANRLVSDSTGIHDYYKENHGVDSSVIAYGAPIQTCENPRRLKELGVEAGKYFLQITRFEPENLPLETLQAYSQLDTDVKMVLVGGTPYESDYYNEVKKLESGNIILPGYIYDQEMLRELWCCSYAYIHGNSVGGTNPALLQTMASGCFVMASDVPFNRDVVQDCGIFYERTVDSLKEKMQWALDNSDSLHAFRKKAVARVREHYDWDVIARQYEELCQELVRGNYPWQFNVRPFLNWKTAKRWLDF